MMNDGTQTPTWLYVLTVLGSCLGYIATGWTIKEKLAKGPKIRALITKNKLKERSVRISSMSREGVQRDEYRADSTISVQFQNSGTDMTSVASVEFDFDSKTYSRFKSVESLTRSTYREPRVSIIRREEDTDVVVIPPGAAVVRDFSFEILSSKPFVDNSRGVIRFDFLNYKTIELEVVLDLTH